MTVCLQIIICAESNWLPDSVKYRFIRPVDTSD